MRIVLLLFLALSVPCGAFAQPYQPGFRTHGIWEDEPPLRLDINIWYPTTRQPKDLSFPPWAITAAHGAKIAEGQFPLLVISHASPADRFAYHTTAAALAMAGFIVVAPTHGGDYMHNMDNLFTWKQLAQRVKEINTALNFVLSDKDFSATIDHRRIGLIGYGSGATAALLIGGALPNCAPWPAYCRKAGLADSYCSPWARDRINSLCENLPLTRSLANTCVRAIAAISPGFGMIFDTESFKYFHTPLLLVTAGRDSFNRSYLHSAPLAKALGSKARLLDLPEADSAALISPCPQALADELPELCLSLAPAQKKAIQDKLTSTLLAFFIHYLVVPENLPTIPEPPNLEPEISEEQGGAQKPTPGKKRKSR